jgi:hypothetical protein
VKEIHKKYRSNKIDFTYDQYSDENFSKLFCFVSLLGPISTTKCHIHLSIFNHSDRIHPSFGFTCYRFKGSIAFIWKKTNNLS